MGNPPRSPTRIARPVERGMQWSGTLHHGPGPSKRLAEPDPQPNTQRLWHLQGSVPEEALMKPTAPSL
ncbi:MAG: hypothetical protein UT01_C0056G0009 [Candidatus Daviesbacteria bacterium GW2011_GWA1_38_7]|nr:MAG: hypothetical protein UT01_C0056G0009 [Candidatus Daviesbacteria bacterium GW2011_GWA1_38_7]